MQTTVQRLARQIDRACRKNSVTELMVVCVMDGAFIFSADLVRAMRTPTRIVFLQARSYVGTKKGATATAALPSSLRGSLGGSFGGSPVLVADTIYDTGRTIAKIVREVRGHVRGHVREKTNQVWLAVLIEKSGKAAVAANDQAQKVFTGIQLSGDPFLIGYGLDVDGAFRDLPDITEYHRISEDRNLGRRGQRGI
ncbi:MAG: hypothetical protein EXQ56_06200 [Acidobacteria bacterium]|nr:hypothetical protein [Acidobacteriota bacterium]